VDGYRSGDVGNRHQRQVPPRRQRILRRSILIHDGRIREPYIDGIGSCEKSSTSGGGSGDWFAAAAMIQSIFTILSSQITTCREAAPPRQTREVHGRMALRSRIPCLTIPLREGKLRADSSDKSRSTKGSTMNALKIVALALIAAGVLGLMYGGFTYTKKTDEAKIGPFEMAVKEKETVNVPVWAGVGAIVVGAALLLVGGRKT
jgi:hypothetical protein